MTLLITLLALVGCLGDEPTDSGPLDPEDSAADGDGDGSPAGLDCDDADPARLPGAEELCDGVDNDCDAVIDEDPAEGLLAYDDKDGDGYGDPDSLAPRCALGEGLTLIGEDCDDNNAEVNPAQAELCLDDGVDEDCDGLIDVGDPDVEGVLVYADNDGDGFGVSSPRALRCTVSPDWASVTGDCADNDAERNPDAKEDCEHDTDQDCDGLYGCEDGDCITTSACTESCNNGEDDDEDGAIDCEDDECWSSCDPRIQSTLNGGWAEVQYSSSWSSGANRYAVHGVAHSLTGSVQFTSGSEQVICDWTVSTVEYDAEYTSTFSSQTFYDGAHGAYSAQLSSACPRTDLPVLPPMLRAIRRGGAGTARGGWYVGTVSLRSQTCHDGGWHGGDCVSEGSIPVLSPTSARWGNCLLTNSMTDTPCLPDL